MPVVRTGRIRYEQGDFKQVTKVNNQGRFTIALPPWTHEILMFKEVGADSLSKVDMNYYAAMKNFEELSTNKEKVLIWTFDANCMLWNEDKTRVTFRVQDLHFSKFIALSFWWRQAYRLTSKFEEHPRYVTLENSRITSDSSITEMKWMSWTPERLHFFEELQRAIENLIMNAHNFFNQERESVALMIDQGMKLLPAPADDKAIP